MCTLERATDHPSLKMKIPISIPEHLSFRMWQRKIFHPRRRKLLHFLHIFQTFKNKWADNWGNSYHQGRYKGSFYNNCTKWHDDATIMKCSISQERARHIYSHYEILWRRWPEPKTEDSMVKRNCKTGITGKKCYLYEKKSISQECSKLATYSTAKGMTPSLHKSRLRKESK